MSFMVITVFLAIRYNYGLDYPSYLELFPEVQHQLHTEATLRFCFIE